MGDKLSASKEKMPEPDEHIDREFDADLQRELDCVEFAGPRTVTGRVVSTGEWTDGDPVELQVWTPYGDPPVFSEELEIPSSDPSLSSCKFGRILATHDYSFSSANHLIGDAIECTYENGEWYVVDPASVTPLYAFDKAWSQLSNPSFLFLFPLLIGFVSWGLGSISPALNTIIGSDAHLTYLLLPILLITFFSLMKYYEYTAQLSKAWDAFTEGVIE